MRVRRGAAAEEAQRFRSHDGVPCAGRDEDGIAGHDRARFAVDLHRPAAFEDEVKLLRQPVVMPLRGAARRDARFGEALVLHGRIRAVEEAADGGAVLGGEGRLVGEWEHGHAGKYSGFGLQFPVRVARSAFEH